MLLSEMATGSLLWHMGKALIKRGLKSTFHNSGFAGAKDRLQVNILDLNHYLQSSVWSTACCYQEKWCMLEWESYGYQAVQSDFIVQQH